MNIPKWQYDVYIFTVFDHLTKLFYLPLSSSVFPLCAGISYRLHHGHEAAGLGPARPGRLLRALGPLETRVGEGSAGPCQPGGHTRACGQVGQHTTHIHTHSNSQQANENSTLSIICFNCDSLLVQPLAAETLCHHLNTLAQFPRSQRSWEGLWDLNFCLPWLIVVLGNCQMINAILETCEMWDCSWYKHAI